ncbi:MAG: hypothetical protein H6603_10615 [Flavobacteriales bacterium]|nr:hypothetical protein [Flavobacteriales bacterium]MCB9190159.1 hypothetical protein [Flavobacteriales bacterium]MCB9205418.1 hypothetical protein [Flavobacteriales bacterium]
MLTAIIRSDTIVGLLLAYLISAALVGCLWFMGVSGSSVTELLLTHWAFSWTENGGTGVVLLSTVLLAGTAVFARVRFREIKETLGGRNLSMLAMVSIIATQANVLFFRPDVLVANLVLVAVFMLIFYTYKKESALSEIFHVGLGIGLASLFVGQSVMLVLSVAFSLLMLRSGNIKEWIVFLLGLVMTAVFMALVVVWTEEPVLSFQRTIQSSWLASVSTSRLSIGHIVLLMMVFLSMSKALSNITAGTVHLRNISLVNLGWIFGVALMILILGVDWRAGLVLAAFPLSNLMAQFIESMNRWWIADLLLLALITAPIFSILWPI